MKLTLLSQIAEARPISQLTEDLLKELQLALTVLGYPTGHIDGLLGPKTRNAWSEFKTDVFQGNPDLIGIESIGKLQEQLNEIEERRGQAFSTKEETVEAIKHECKTQNIGLNPQMAYVLATVQWETAQTFKPVREAFWQPEDWRRQI